jgi:hypothetical protein
MNRIASLRYQQGVNAPNDLVAELAEGLPPGRTAMTDTLDDAGVGTYITAISAALNTSREQTLTIIANLDFMDSVAR